MLIQFDCCDCIMKQILQMAREVSSASELRWKFFREFLEIFQRVSKDSSPPELAAAYFDLYAQMTGIEDGYKDIKRRSTELGRAVYGELAKYFGTQILPGCTSGDEIKYFLSLNNENITNRRVM